MSGAPTPQVLLEAIASSAGAGFITSPMPEAPTGTLAASVQGGFPPVTMTDVQAGGKPPLGQDANGFFNLVSGHTVWVESGQLYPFNAALAAAQGGYALGALIEMADGSGIWQCISDGTQVNPDTTPTGAWTPLYSYGLATVPVTGGTTTLTPAQYKKSLILLTGTLTSNQVINFPNAIQEWNVINLTTGAFSTTLKTASVGSVGVVSPQGGKSAPLGIYALGDNNVYPTVAPLSVPIDQDPTPLTLVERTNNGYVLATFFNSNATVDNPTIVNVITDPGDGFFHKNSLTNFESQVLLQGLGGQLVNGQVPFSVISQWASTLFASPTLTGTPLTPTAALGTSNSQIASTQFVNPGSTLTGAGPWSRKNPDGSIEQWGATTVNLHVGAQNINFGIAFPNSCQTVNLSLEAAAVGYDYWIVNGSKTVNGFQFNNDAGSAGIVVVNWRAIGR